ncbi:hypothetical protein ONR57_04090 [Hoyosella sp. YIM 151337]|uniref:adenylate/guanylate cyclase domain-containing protein n=1 Tax=Hoyosella sp. YIM 151337 TaxID=2992742 RepID=UPI002236394D|nr:adenylate/guanylate cyclase domain-containing protein [Hoyosella sp. YIM 151337]MCW4352480.1 hypothetical protein [Hoyosella sp. YIM 151337]
MNDGVPPDSGQEMARRLLGATPVMTLSEAAEAAGVTHDRALRYWRALGLTDPVGDERVFTDEDVRGFGVLAKLEADVDPEGEIGAALLRALGHHMSRLASWHVMAMEERAQRAAVSSADTSSDVVRTGVSYILDHVDDIDDLVRYSWRRQLTEIAAWRLGRDTENAQKLMLSVGFADMVSFTSLVRTLAPDELARLVTRFELIAMDVVLRRRGRVIKLVGDAVLFVADTPLQGAAIACELSAALSERNQLPAVRVGMATGEVVSRLGDIFGQPVNVASRLTEQAPPGAVLVDATTASAVEKEYETEPCEVRKIRGVGLVAPSILKGEA